MGDLQLYRRGGASRPPGSWLTRERELVPVEEMEDGHLFNTAMMLLHGTYPARRRTAAAGVAFMIANAAIPLEVVRRGLLLFCHPNARPPNTPGTEPWDDELQAREEDDDDDR